MSRVGYGILGALGIIFVIGGSVFVGIFPEIMRNKIKAELPIVNGSDSYDRWQKVKVPITMKFHFFVLNNSDSYTSLDDIELIERGPYVYDETRFKQDIFKIGDDMISYQENRTYTFKKDNNLDETDEITFINFPVLGLFQNENFFSKIAAPKIFEAAHKGDPDVSYETSFFIKRKVVDLLFNGLPFKMFAYIKKNMASIGVDSTYAISEGGKNILEKEWTINTGEKDIDKIGNIVKFDNMSSLTNKDGSKIWPYTLNKTAENNCIKLKGTDGTLFAPSVSKGDILYAYEPQLCRKVFFYFWKETEVRGISTYRFVVPDDYFKTLKQRPENECYCVQKNAELCNTKGLLDISNCDRQAFYSPIHMSAPYYNHGDDKLREQFKTKLEPKKRLNDDNYGTYLDIEPMTGTVLRAVRRLQVNIKVDATDPSPATNTLLQKIMPQLGASKKHKSYVVPVFWIEESAEADEDQANEFKSMVTNKKKLANGISITVIVIGALMTIAAIYLYIRSR